MAEQPAYVIAQARLSAEARERFLEAVPDLVERSRAEEGCIEYDLYVSASDPLAVVTVERWRDRARLDAHLAAPHTQAFLALAAHCVAVPPSITAVAPAAVERIA